MCADARRDNRRTAQLSVLNSELQHTIVEVFARALLADLKATETTAATGVAPAALKTEEQPSGAP